MFFKFNDLTGRISPSEKAKVYNPANVAVAEGPKASVFKFESSKVKAASLDDLAFHSSASSRRTGAGAKTLGTIPKDAGYAKIVELQKKWSADDGLLVWQKRGIRDSGPYYVSLVGVAFGAAYAFYILYKMSFPKKQE